jgi:hypothetical protein
MTLTAEQIVNQVRALAPAERLRVVEQIVHDLAAEVTPRAPSAEGAIWADENDAEFDAFQLALQRLRDADVWRAGDGSDAA